jgi:CBS domain-containing protein
MPEELATLGASVDSIEFAHTIGEAKVRRVPVVDENSDLKSLVTLDDLGAT